MTVETKKPRHYLTRKEYDRLITDELLMIHGSQTEPRFIIALANQQFKTPYWAEKEINYRGFEVRSFDLQKEYDRRVELFGPDSGLSKEDIDGICDYLEGVSSLTSPARYARSQGISLIEWMRIDRIKCRAAMERAACQQ